MFSHRPKGKAWLRSGQGMYTNSTLYSAKNPAAAVTTTDHEKKFMTGPIGSTVMTWKEEKRTMII